MVLTTFYVDASLFLAADRDSSGGLTAGDQVTFGHGQAYEQAQLTYDAAPAAGDAGAAFNSIGQALASPLVQAGDTIDVAGGTYMESSLTINKSITLQGVGAGYVCISPELGNLGGGIGLTITASASNVTIADLAVNGFHNSLSADGVDALTLRNVGLQNLPPITAVFPLSPVHDGISGVRNLNLVSTYGAPMHVSVEPYQIARGAAAPWIGGYVKWFGSLAITNIGLLSITTGAGDDTFSISPLVEIPISIDAGEPASPATPGDTLTVNLGGAEGGAVTVSQDTSGSTGSWTFSNRQSIGFRNFETFEQTSALPQNISWLIATEGVDTGFQVVAKFTDAAGASALADYSASIVWGDGASSEGAVSFDPASGLFSVSGSHVFLEDGFETISVTLHRIGYADVTMLATATVVEGPIQGSGLTLFGSEGLPLATTLGDASVDVATFTHGEGLETFANPGSATIDWGDGTTSTGTVGQYPAGSPKVGAYHVSSAHTYQHAGVYTVIVTVIDDGHPTRITSKAVINAPVVPEPPTSLPHGGDAPQSPSQGAQGSANQRFIASVFVSLLDRQIDPDGLRYWTDELDGGAPREQIIAGIQNSDEYRHAEINSLFQTFLHRSADPQALDAHNALLIHGETLEQLAAIIVSSDEYFQRRGGGSNDGFLASLFQDALHRGIEDSAKTAFEQMLSQGATRAQIADLVFGSREYRSDEVQSLYQQALGRDADSAGENYWVDKLAHGERDEQILAEISSSEEFFDKTA